MAEQQGFSTYSGKLGNMIGYRRGDKHYERMKPRSYEPSEESQKSSTEFGRGSTGCALLKSAFTPLLLKAFSVDLHNRLAEKLRNIIRTGPVSKKGDRVLFDGDLSLLQGFEFNSKVSFSNLCSIPISTSVSAKEIKIAIPPFNWQDYIKAPKKAVGVKMGMCCVFADFNTNEFTAIKANYLQLAKNERFLGGRFKIAIPAREELAVLLMMNVAFEWKGLNESSVIEDKRYQAGVILESVHMKDGQIVKFVNEELANEEVNVVEQADAFWTLGWDEE